jgi:hypothetical protein
MDNNFDQEMMQKFNENKEASNKEKTENTEKTENPTQEKVADEQTKTEENNTENVQANNEETTEEVKTESEITVDSFNKVFETEYENIDTVKELLKEYPGLKAQLEDKDKTIVERDEVIKQQFNPMSYFANEKQFKLNQILKQNEGLNESIVSRLMNSNLDELSDKDVLKLNDLIKTKGTFDDKIVEMDIEDRYGLNVNKEDLDEKELQAFQVKEYRMKRDAETAKEELSKLMNIELPEFQDPLNLKNEAKEAQEKAFNETKESWGKFTEDFLEKFEKINIPYKTDDKEEAVFEFMVDDKFKKDMSENLPIYAAMMGKDVNNKDDVKAVVSQVQKDYVWNNISNIVKNIHEDTVTKMTQEQFEKFHNTSKPEKAEAPLNLSDEERHNQEQKEKMINDFKLKK